MTGTRKVTLKQAQEAWDNMAPPDDEDNEFEGEEPDFLQMIENKSKGE